MFFGTLAHLICFLLLFPCNHLQASYRQTPTVRTQTSCWWETRRTWPTSGRFRRSRPRSWLINTGGFCFSMLCVWCMCLIWNNDPWDIKKNTVYFSFAYSVICSQEDVTGLSESSLQDVIFSLSLTTLCYPSVGL